MLKKFRGGFDTEAAAFSSSYGIIAVVNFAEKFVSKTSGSDGRLKYFLMPRSVPVDKAHESGEHLGALKAVGSNFVETGETDMSSGIHRLFATSKFWAIMCVVLAMLWISAEFRAWHLRGDLKSVWQNAVTVIARDADTGNEVTASITSPGTTIGQEFPRIRCIGSSNLRQTIDCMAIAPVLIGVSADGYEKKQIELSEKSRSVIEVLLQPAHTRSLLSQSQSSTGPQQ